MVEKHLVGGDCLNFGCVPSKSLISLAKISHYAKESKKLGLAVTGSIDMEKVAEYIKEKQEIIRAHENPEYFRKQGIDVELGAAKFNSKKSIEVNGKTFTARKIIIATGSRPIVPPIKGIEKVSYFTNESLFSNKILPKKFLVIGGGPIGIEMAQSYQRLGSQVTVLNRGDRILSKEEPEVSEIMEKVLTGEGIKFLQGYDPVRFEGSNILIVKKRDSDEPQKGIEFDAVLIATGRKLNIDGMNLEAAGIKKGERKIELNDYLVTSNPNVVVCGDAAGIFMFTHWAETEAGLIIKNMLSPIKKKINRKIITWVTYTDPEVASFGLPPQVSKETNYHIETFDLAEVDRAIASGAKHGMIKLYIKDNKILSGTIVAPNAGEIAGELTLAMTLGIKVSKIFERVYPYPTMARINKRVIAKYLGRKLTNTNKKILKGLFKVFN